VGSQARIGGQVGIAGHIHLADRIEIQAQSGVHTGKYPEGSRIFGYPAIQYMDYLKSYAVFKQLPEYTKRIEELEKQIAELKKNVKMKQKNTSEVFPTGRCGASYREIGHHRI
jgi:UDP-3-O-[3-hydroxymyristoyl] glucosamine N-acyltransferase